MKVSMAMESSINFLTLSEAFEVYENLEIWQILKRRWTWLISGNFGFTGLIAAKLDF